MFQLIEQGMVTHEHLVTMFASYMSDRDIGDMLDANELSERFFEEDEDDGQPDEAQEWNDFDPDC